MIPYFFSPSRLIFAMAMDRVVPSCLAAVNPKTGAPTHASHVTLLFALVGVLLNFFNVAVVLGTILFCAVFMYWLYGLSALLLPYRRPDLARLLEPHPRILGMPLISVVGVLTFAVGWFVLFVAIRQLNMPIAITLSVLMAAVVLLYLARLIAAARQGLSLDIVYSQLPPE